MQPDIQVGHGRHDVSILIVEDDPNIGIALEFELRREGYACRVVTNGEEALSAVAEFAPDLILLDLMLPKLGGEEVLRALTESEALDGTKVFMMTASRREAGRAAAASCGADAFFEKPFLISGL